MKLAKKLSLLLSLAAAMTLSAHAQDAKAKFTLAHDAHIGAAMLPAGQYTMTLSFDGFTKAIIAPVDRKGAGMIRAAGVHRQLRRLLRNHGQHAA